MIIKEEKKDLFSVDSKYYLVHCISADYKMGAGIALEFEKRFHIKSSIKKDDLKIEVGTTLFTNNKIFNLITKEKYYNKPTYTTLRNALDGLKSICITRDIKYLAMPRIGCGLDKLYWNTVKIILEQVFYNTDIEILVCYL